MFTFLLFSVFLMLFVQCEWQFWFYLWLKFQYWSKNFERFDKSFQFSRQKKIARLLKDWMITATIHFFLKVVQKVGLVF